MIEANINNQKPFSDVLLVILSILGGLVFGVFSGIVGYFIYLVFLSPLLMGFIAGKLTTDNAKLAKNTNKRIILVASLLTAVVLYISFHYTRYVILQLHTTWLGFGELSDEGLKLGSALVQYTLRQETGYSGFLGYMLFKASEGVTIGRIFRSSGINPGPILTWVYWVFEFGVITFIAFKASENLTKRPLCEVCRTWYPEPRHIGGVPENEGTEVLNLIKQRDFPAVGKMLEENPDAPSTELYLQSCISCQKSPSFLTFANARFVNGRLILKEVMKTTLSPMESNLFVKEITFLGNS